jgi:hypothetical protein
VICLQDRFKDLLQREAKLIDTYFDIARYEGCGKPQDVSDRREAKFNNFLSKYYPFPFRIVKGSIIDSNGKNSDSIDSIVLNVFCK